MKKLSLLSVMSLYVNLIFAQWITSGTNIYNSNTGNVGIANTSPAFLLSVGNNSGISTTTYPARITSVFGTNTADAGITTRQQNGVEGFLQSSTVGVFFGTFSNHNLYFRTNDLDKAVLLANGNMGIGTMNPGTFKLAVEGKIGAREVQVTNTNPWPDYVFEPSYKLMTLAEVEKFINEHKHLPDVPSAADTKDGIELGKMNAILLRKIEELTLHVIELNKKIEKLENDPS